MVDEDHTKIAILIDEQDKFKWVLSRHKDFVTKEKDIHWNQFKKHVDSFDEIMKQPYTLSRYEE